jgi:hypothetical protein
MGTMREQPANPDAELHLASVFLVGRPTASDRQLLTFATIIKRYQDAFPWPVLEAMSRSFARNGKHFTAPAFEAFLLAEWDRAVALSARRRRRR